jgi:hypothetical protein
VGCERRQNRAVAMREKEKHVTTTGAFRAPPW